MDSTSFDDTRLSARLHDTDTDLDSQPVDHLIEQAVRGGRRRLVLRRSVGAGGAALALAAVVGVGVQLAGPGTTTVAPAGNPSVSAEPSSAPSGSTGPTADPPTNVEVGRVLRAVLPDTVTVRDFTADQDGLTMALVDDAGTVWAGGGLQPTSKEPAPCENSKFSSCSKRAVDGGTLYVSRDLEKVGDGVWYSFDRADGRTVWFGQRAATDGNGPTTRDGVPLTDAQVQTMLTDPAWDALAARCTGSGLHC